MLHRIEMPDGGVSYVGDKLNDEINAEMLKMLKEFCSNVKSDTSFHPPTYTKKPTMELLDKCWQQTISQKPIIKNKKSKKKKR